MQEDNMMILHQTAKGTLKTVVTEFDISAFYDGLDECIVLHYGDIQSSEYVYCRFHSQCFTGHVFNSIECDCNEQMLDAQKRISEEGKGLIILLHQEGKGNGAVAHIASQNLKSAGLSQSEAYEELGFRNDSRNYDIAIKVLNFFDVSSVVMQTDNVEKLTSLKAASIDVVKKGAIYGL